MIKHTSTVGTAAASLTSANHASSSTHRMASDQQARYSFPMRRLLLNFQCNQGVVLPLHRSGLQNFCRRAILGRADPTILRRMVIKLRCEDIADFDHSIRAWARMSVYGRLSHEQRQFLDAQRRPASAKDPIPSHRLLQHLSAEGCVLEAAVESFHSESKRMRGKMKRKQGFRAWHSLFASAR